MARQRRRVPDYFGSAPEHLCTAAQLKARGLKERPGQPVVGILRIEGKRNGEPYSSMSALFDVSEAVPIPETTEEEPPTASQTASGGFSSKGV